MWRWSSRSRARSGRVALALALALLAGGSAADDGWLPLLTQDGVDVFERAAPGRALPELRARVEIGAALADVLEVIRDVPAQTTWMYQCVESRVVRRDSDDAALVYNRIGTPWPAAQRDSALDTRLDTLGPDRVVIRFRSVVDPAAPPVEGVVRMPRLEGEFSLDALDPGRTRVTYRVDIDPGGSLPTWLARRYARELPLETLLGLRRRVAETASRLPAPPGQS